MSRDSTPEGGWQGEQNQYLVKEEKERGKGGGGGKEREEVEEVLMNTDKDPVV